MYRYRLTFEPDDNDTLLVTSPDFPALVTFGENKAFATRRAEDALETLIEVMMNHGEDIPIGRAPSGKEPYISLPLQASLKVELYRQLRSASLTRADLQRRLKWQRESVDRLFRLGHNSKISQIEEAFLALGKEVSVEARDAPRETEAA